MASIALVAGTDASGYTVVAGGSSGGADAAASSSGSLAAPPIALYSLNLALGTIRWRALVGSVGAVPSAAPAGADNDGAAAAAPPVAALLRAVHPDEARQTWLVVSDFCATAVASADGSALWSQCFPPSPDSRLIASTWGAGGALLLLSPNPATARPYTLFAYAAANGDTLWTYELPPALASSSPSAGASLALLAALTGNFIACSTGAALCGSGAPPPPVPPLALLATSNTSAMLLLNGSGVLYFDLLAPVGSLNLFAPLQPQAEAAAGLSSAGVAAVATVFSLLGAGAGCLALRVLQRRGSGGSVLAKVAPEGSAEGEGSALAVAQGGGSSDPTAAAAAAAAASPLPPAASPVTSPPRSSRFPFTPYVPFSPAAGAEAASPAGCGSAASPAAGSEGGASSSTNPAAASSEAAAAAAGGSEAPQQQQQPRLAPHSPRSPAELLTLAKASFTPSSAAWMRSAPSEGKWVREAPPGSGSARRGAASREAAAAAAASAAAADAAASTATSGIPLLGSAFPSPPSSAEEVGAPSHPASSTAAADASPPAEQPAAGRGSAAAPRSRGGLGVLSVHGARALGLGGAAAQLLPASRAASRASHRHSSASQSAGAAIVAGSGGAAVGLNLAFRAQALAFAAAPRTGPNRGSAKATPVRLQLSEERL